VNKILSIGRAHVVKSDYAIGGFVFWL